MPTLLELQNALRRSLVDRDDRAAAAMLAAQVAPDRLDIYRNTFVGSLTKALRLCYPAVHRLVGDDFFDATAGAVIGENPPGSAYLDEYGAELPAFLLRFPPAAGLAYLPDVAHLEWAVSRAAHAPDLEPIDPARLVVIAPEQQGRICFTPNPSVGLVRSDYPVDVIWQGVLSGNDAALAAIDLAAGSVPLLVQRLASGVTVVRLDDRVAFCGRALQWRAAAGCARCGKGPRRLHAAGGTLGGSAICWIHPGVARRRMPDGCPTRRDRIMSKMVMPGAFRSPAFIWVGHLLRVLDRVPYALLALPLRAAIATVFWNSGMTKLANWDTTIALFVDEYQVPLLPPEVAASMAATIELTTPVLLVLGLLTRAASSVLLGMTTVIEIFVYPQAWPTHIQWAAMLLILICRGPGKLSIDHLLWRRFRHRLGVEGQSA